jgi:hypothetical protein
MITGHDPDPIPQRLTCDKANDHAYDAEGRLCAMQADGGYDLRGLRL